MKKKWFMTMKYNLEQSHCSFQEDVAIDGNFFFKGWSLKTGGEEKDIDSENVNTSLSWEESIIKE